MVKYPGRALMGRTRPNRRCVSHEPLADILTPLPGRAALSLLGPQTLPAQLFKTRSRHSVLAASFQAGRLRAHLLPTSCL